MTPVQLTHSKQQTEKKVKPNLIHCDVSRGTVLACCQPAKFALVVTSYQVAEVMYFLRENPK